METIHNVVDLRRNSRRLMTFVLQASLLILLPQSASYAQNPFQDLEKRFEEAIVKGIDDGLRRGRPGVVGSPAAFLRNASDRYSDPGEDTSRHEWDIAVGHVRFTSGTADGANDDLQRLGMTANPNMDRLAASVEWRCFGATLMSPQKYKESILGFPVQRHLPSEVIANQRKHELDLINNWIKQFEEMTGPALHPQMKKMLGNRIHQLPSGSIGTAARIIALNPSSPEAAEFALALVKRAFETRPEDIDQAAACGLIYLEDRYDRISDEEVLQRYDQLLDGGSPTRSGRPLNCPIAVSLATAYLEIKRPDKAHAAIERTRAIADEVMQSPPSRIDPSNKRDCKYVYWLDGMMEMYGLGTNRSPTNAALALSKCSDVVSVCAYNLALLYLSGEVRSDDPLQPARLLQQASKNGTREMRANATALLNKHFTKSQRMAAEVPRAFLQYAATMGVFIKSCLDDKKCAAYAARQNSRSSSADDSGFGSQSKCNDTSFMTMEDIAVMSVASGGRCLAP